ncbi:hypothetical protein IJZ97_02540 [bacterium]|nr:hypothetical protein [bacterium]
MIGKILKFAILAVFVIIFSLNVVRAEVYNGKVLQTGISLTELVPSVFFGTWRVESVLTETNSPSNFKKKNIDIWNLSKEGNVINLSNPFSGASASITLSYVENGVIRFTKIGNYNGRVLTDTVELNMNGGTFVGVNELTLETLSDIDNSIIKTAKATYSLKGEKIAGESIGE